MATASITTQTKMFTKEDFRMVKMNFFLFFVFVFSLWFVLFMNVGLKHGYGIYYYSNGDRYEGHFKEGQRDSHGILKFANGDKYEGGKLHLSKQSNQQNSNFLNFAMPRFFPFFFHRVQKRQTKWPGSLC